MGAKEYHINKNQNSKDIEVRGADPLDRTLAPGLAFKTLPSIG